MNRTKAASASWPANGKRARSITIVPIAALIAATSVTGATWAYDVRSVISPAEPRLTRVQVGSSDAIVWQAALIDARSQEIVKADQLPSVRPPLNKPLVSVVPVVKPVRPAHVRLASVATTENPRKARSGGVLLGRRGTLVEVSPLTRRWNRVRALADASQDRLSACMNDSSACSSPEIKQWAAIVSGAQGMRTGRKISYINSAINRTLTYREDSDLWKQLEHWATPEETLQHRAGDCEDYAILKYWSLRQLGFEDRDMRVVALNDRAARQQHAVLAVRYNGDWLILDNRFSRLMMERNVPNYESLFSVNRTEQWSHVTPKGTPVRLAARFKGLGKAK